jgi:hypothetical protein
MMVLCGLATERPRHRDRRDALTGAGAENRMSSRREGGFQPQPYWSTTRALHRLGERLLSKAGFFLSQLGGRMGIPGCRLRADKNVCPPETGSDVVIRLGIDVLAGSIFRGL